MTAANPVRRTQTARELAKKFGCSERFVRNLIAEPRDEWEARSRARQDEALALRKQGLSHAEVGKALGVSRDTAAGLVRRAKARRASQSSPAAAA